MKKEWTLKENITWLLEQYKKSLQEEKAKKDDEQNIEMIWDYENIIIELEFALKISK